MWNALLHFFSIHPARSICIPLSFALSFLFPVLVIVCMHSGYSRRNEYDQNPYPRIPRVCWGNISTEYTPIQHTVTLSLAVAIAVAFAATECYAPSITQPYVGTRTYKKCARAIAESLLPMLLEYFVVVISVLFRFIICMYVVHCTQNACCVSLMKQYNGMNVCLCSRAFNNALW